MLHTIISIIPLWTLLKECASRTASQYFTVDVTLTRARAHIFLGNESKGSNLFFFFFWDYVKAPWEKIEKKWGERGKVKRDHRSVCWNIKHTISDQMKKEKRRHVRQLWRRPIYIYTTHKTAVLYVIQIHGGSTW